MELQFDIPTNRFRFYALEIDLGTVTLDKKPLMLTANEAGLVSASTETVIEPGYHVLEIGFTNNFNRDGSGIYKVEIEGKSYLFTQMKPIDARRAFPCWDEPSFKIPWGLTLTVSSDHDAVSNMQSLIVVSETSNRL